MSTKFQIKRSSVSGKTPNTTNISPGELAINLTDQKLYSSNGTAIFEIGAASDTSRYLEVANAAFVVGNNTTQYLEVANAVGLIQENTNQFLAVANATVYLEVANVSQYIPANTSISTVAYESTNTTLTVTTEDGRNLDADLSGLVDEVRANTSISNVAFTSANNNLKIQTEHGTVFSVDLSPLVVSTTEYLEVANAAPLIANQTTHFLEVANAEPLIANLTTKYLEVANTVYNYKTTFNYTATAGQKEFTGTDLNGQVLDYYGNTAEVFLNGIKQIKGTDWYANTDSIVTLSVGAGVNDTVEIVSVNAITEFVSAPDLTAYLVQSDLNPYLEVANLASQTEQYMQVANLAQVATTGNYSHLTGTPSLATVATTGSYNDLSGTPTIPSTDPFLQVANAVPLIQENTSKYLEVANVVATDTSAYLEKANASIYLEVANLAAETSKYLEKANASIYLEVANVAANTSTSSAAISGNTATFTRADGSTFTLDVSTLYDRYVVSSNTSGNNLTITLNDGSDVTVDLGPLVAGAANNLYVQSGAVSGNTLTLTLNDASTVDIDVASINDTTNYLEVANAAPLIANQTTQFLTVANAAPLIANLTTKYMEVANIEYNYKSSFHFNANAGQTEFTGTDQNGQTLDYYGNTAEVYLNGIKLIRGSDWYANTDSIVTISEPAGTGDVLEIVSINTITQFISAPDLTAYLVQSDLNPYLEVANLTSQTTKYMEVANLAQVATTGNYSHLTGTPSLATVATTGSYNDLSGTPTIPTTTEYLQVANAVALIANNTTKYLEVANATSGPTSQYLEVANAAALIANNTTKYLEVANGVASVDTTLTGNTSIQRLDIEDNAGTAVFSTTLKNGLFFGNNYFISSYDFEKNTTSTSKTIIASTRGDEVAVEFLVLVTDTTTSPPVRQFSKILAIHDGEKAFISEYGQMYTGSGPLASFSATFQKTPDYIYLYANATTSNRLKYKVTRMGMRD